MNTVIIWDVYILSNTEKFTTEFIRIKIKFIMNFYLEYNQMILHPESWNIIRFQTLLKLLWMMTLLQDITNSINQFYQIKWKILKKQIPDQINVFVNNVIVKNLITNYNRVQIIENVR